jgi:hypothetical protein
MEVVLLIALFVFFAWFANWVAWGRSKSLRCPRCGQRMPVGVPTCAQCGFDLSGLSGPPSA